jgi:hypothetical protein
MSNFPAVTGLGADLQTALVENVQVNTSSAGGGAHLKYGSYNGEWSFGVDAEDATNGEVTIFTPSIVHGWHLWCDKKVYKEMVPFTSPLPQTLPPVEDERGKLQQANEARGFQCMMEFEDEGDPLQLSWEHSTVGCRSAIDSVLIEIRKKAVGEADYLYPVVKLTSRTPYENPHKSGEMIHPPELEIVGWRNQEGDWEGEKAEKIAAPKAEEPVEEAEEAPAAPVKRRRTSKAS